MIAAPSLPRILAVHPMSRGFGWVLFEGPLAPIDWGFSVTKGDKNLMCLEKVDALISRNLPEILILEAFEPRYSNRSERMTRLGRALQTLAASRGINAAVFSRIDVKSCFQVVGARSRDEIAEAIARNLPVFQAYLPRRRVRWHGENNRLALFSAAALALTHYYLDTNRLFHDLPGHKPDQSREDESRKM